jgi:hypothetical protein
MRGISAERELTRRQTLLGAVAGTATLAGCLGSGDGGSGPEFVITSNEFEGALEVTFEGLETVTVLGTEIVSATVTLENTGDEVIAADSNQSYYDEEGTVLFESEAGPSTGVEIEPAQSRESQLEGPRAGAVSPDEISRIELEVVAD